MRAKRSALAERSAYLRSVFLELIGPLRGASTNCELLAGACHSTLPAGFLDRFDSRMAPVQDSAPYGVAGDLGSTSLPR